MPCLRPNILRIQLQTQSSVWKVFALVPPCLPWYFPEGHCDTLYFLCLMINDESVCLVFSLLYLKL